MIGIREQIPLIMRCTAPAALLAFQLLGMPLTLAQTNGRTDQTQTDPYLEPLPEDSGEGKGPSVAFRVRTEINLPGPLPGPGPRLVEGRLLTPVAGGMAASGWGEGAEVALLPEGDPALEPVTEDGPLWAVSPDGRIRVAPVDSGHLLAQKRCKRCRSGWRKKWKLRLGGANDTPPPLVTNDRVFFGAMDNRVYSVKRKNGHRVWEVDVQGRVSRSLERWQGALLGADQTDAQPWEGEPLDVILVIPHHGIEILALDAHSGAKVASYTLPENAGRMIGSPLLTPDGKIVVARQNYAPGDASLMVLDLVIPGPSGAPAGPDI